MIYPQAAARGYAERSLTTFLEADECSKDKKPRTLGWIAGVIRSSSLRGAGA